MTLQENLSNMIRTIKKRRNLTITAFSKELGISRSAMQDLLNGDGNPTIATVERIADHLDMKPSSLFLCSNSDEDLDNAYFLLQTIDAFHHLACEEKAKSAELFQDLIVLLNDGQD